MFPWCSDQCFIRAGPQGWRVEFSRKERGGPRAGGPGGGYSDRGDRGGGMGGGMRSEMKCVLQLAASLSCCRCNCCLYAQLLEQC